jgi:hypothetical protein
MECGGQRLPRVCDGARTQSNNLVEVTATQFDEWFVDPLIADFRFRNARALNGQGVDVASVVDDFCGRLRDAGPADIRAVDHQAGQPCVTTMGGGGNDRRFFGG